MNDMQRRRVRTIIEQLRESERGIRAAADIEELAYANLEAASPGSPASQKTERAASRLRHAVDSIGDTIEMLGDAIA